MSERSVEDELKEAVKIAHNAVVFVADAKDTLNAANIKIDCVVASLIGLNYRLGVIEGMLLGKKYDQANSK